MVWPCPRQQRLDCGCACPVLIRESSLTISQSHKRPYRAIQKQSLSAVLRPLHRLQAFSARLGTQYLLAKLRLIYLAHRVASLTYTFKNMAEQMPSRGPWPRSLNLNTTALYPEIVARSLGAIRFPSSASPDQRAHILHKMKCAEPQSADVRITITSNSISFDRILSLNPHPSIAISLRSHRPQTSPCSPQHSRSSSPRHNWPPL